MALVLFDVFLGAERKQTKEQRRLSTVGRCPGPAQCESRSMRRRRVWIRQRGEGTQIEQCGGSLRYSQPQTDSKAIGTQIMYLDELKVDYGQNVQKERREYDGASAEVSASRDHDASLGTGEAHPDAKVAAHQAGFLPQSPTHQKRRFEMRSCQRKDQTLTGHHLDQT